MRPTKVSTMSLLDGALIALVMLAALGVLAVVARMLSDADGDGIPDVPWPPWRRHGGRDWHAR